MILSLVLQICWHQNNRRNNIVSFSANQWTQQISSFFRLQFIGILQIFLYANTLITDLILSWLICFLHEAGTQCIAERRLPFIDTLAFVQAFVSYLALFVDCGHLADLLLLLQNVVRGGIQCIHSVLLTAREVSI